MARQEIELRPYPALRSRSDDPARSNATGIRSSLAARLPECLLVLIILTLPLQVSKTLFPVQQIEFSRLLMAVAFVWMLFVGRSRGWPISRAMTISVGLVLALLVASLALTRWETGILLVLAPLYYACFALFVAMTVRDRVAVAMVAGAIISAGVYVSLVSITLGVTDVYLWRDGVFGTLGRGNATFWDPNIAARFLNIALVVLFAVVATVRMSARRRWAPVAFCVVLIAASIVLTQSRFGWITAIGILPVAIVAYRPRRAVAAFSGLFVVAFIALVALNGTAASRAGELAAGVSHSLGGDASIDSRGNLVGADDVTYTPPREVIGHSILERLPIDGIRYYLLEAGMAMWEDNPIIGVGVGGFKPQILGEYREFIPGQRLAAPVVLPHTFLSQIAAEHGVVGLAVLAIFLAVLARIVVQAVRGARFLLLRSAAVAVGLTMLIIFISSQVSGGFLVDPYLWLAIGMLAAIHRLVMQDRTRPEPRTARS